MPQGKARRQPHERAVSGAGATVPGRRHGGAIAVAIWLLALAIAFVIALRSRYVADLSAFLPSAPTAEQAVLLDQLKSGSASRLILVGIEGGDAATRNAASQRLGARLRATPYFASVDNGDTAPWQQAGRFVFAHRYALSPAVDAARFQVEGLRAAIDETLSLLGTPAGALIKPILLRDPTGETVRIAEALTPAQAPKVEDGVWVSRSAPRAVLLLTTRADGADLDGQQQALNAIRNAFAEEAQASRAQTSPPRRHCVSSSPAPAASASPRASGSRARSSGSRSGAGRSWSSSSGWRSPRCAPSPSPCCRWRAACSPASPRSRSASARCTA